MSVSIELLVFWAAVAVCIVAQAAILRAVFARPLAPPGDTATGRGPTARWGAVAECVWAVVPALALAAVFIATWRTLPGHAAGVWLAAPPASGP